MEIRDPVHGTIPFFDAEASIIDSPEYQRLRSIKQLGFSEFSFPGATHNRYLHSLGVCHLAGQAFDLIFKNFQFSSESKKKNLRQALRLGALLHDVGHGPLSHAIEMVMPPLKELQVGAYENRLDSAATSLDLNRQANHEDYTIKFITDSNLTEILRKNFSDLQPLHVACLVDKSLKAPDDFFKDRNLDFRPILSQLVSSELDVDRMDYLERDSYFCGTNYGKVDTHWLLANMTYHRVQDRLYLALNRRALYTFDDFLVSRHHMHLMVYFHHKSIIYEEMLSRYLSSPDCTFKIPASIKEYTRFTDFHLFEHLAQSKNSWAKQVAERRPYRVLLELHSTELSERPEKIKSYLEQNGVDVIWSSSSTRLSKYHSGNPEDRASSIFVVDQYDRWDRPMPINQSTEIFQRYEGTRIIDRLYVSPEKFERADQMLQTQRL
jgi:uncharacterized protein